MLAFKIRRSLLLGLSKSQGAFHSSCPHWVHSQAWDTKLPSDVCLIAATRTPLGSLQGSLSSLSATDLGSQAIRGAIAKAGLTGRTNHVNEVIMGNVLSANLGQVRTLFCLMLVGIPQNLNHQRRINPFPNSFVGSVGVVNSNMKISFT